MQFVNADVEYISDNQCCIVFMVVQNYVVQNVILHLTIGLTFIMWHGCLINLQSFGKLILIIATAQYAYAYHTLRIMSLNDLKWIW